MPNVTVALTSAMQTQLGIPGVTSTTDPTGVIGWAVYFNAGGTSPVWTQLTGATTVLSLPDQKGLKVYFILQSTDSVSGITPLSNSNSVKDKITTESQIVPTGVATSAETLNYRYDSFEVTFTPAAADAGNLTDINGFGIPMAVEVVYSGTTPNTSASRGYLISGGSVGSGGIWDALASAGGSGSIQYFSAISSGGYATSDPRMAISPATAIANHVSGTTYAVSNWNPYIAALSSSGATTSGGPNQIQLAGYFNGAPDGNNVWHNAGFYAYNVTTSGSSFVLTPGATSQIQGTITISAADLANSIYMTLGNATVSGLTDSSGNPAPLTMNTGANNEWGAVLRDFIAGFTAGYWDATTTSRNSNVSGSLILNKEWNQDPTYAFGGSVSSGPGSVTPSGTVVYDEYAKVFFNSTNSYGNGYSDFLTRAYNVGPLINVSDGSGSATDSNSITVTLFADSDTTSGYYTSQTINNYLPGGSGGYLAPAGVNTNGIQTTLNFNVGTMSLEATQSVAIVLKGAGSGGSDVSIPLATPHSSGSASTYAGNYGIISNGSGGYVTSGYGNATDGVINIKDLPVTAATSSSTVNWYQIVVGSGTAQKIFNLYETVDSSGNILNPAYTGSGAVASAIAIDGLAAVTGTGTGQYITSSTGMTIGFQNGGTDTLDPSLMAIVPFPGPVSSGSPPNGLYPEPTAALVGWRPGYTSASSVAFRELYDVWNVQSSVVSSATSGSATWTVPTASAVTVYNGGLVFGWNGADSAAVQQQAALATPNDYVNSYTNKIAGLDVARLFFTAVSGAALPSEIVSSGGYLTVTADTDGNWQTVTPIQFANGTYTIQMQEFLPTDSGFATPLNSASVVQSFTVAQGETISSFNLSVDTGQTSNGLILTSGGEMTVNGGTTSATLISAGGIEYVKEGTDSEAFVLGGVHQIWAGATAASMTIFSGGSGQVWGSSLSATISGGGFQYVSGAAAPAIATSTTVNSGGNQYIQSNGSAAVTVVSSGAIQVVEAGGAAISTLVGGRQYVSASALATSTTVQGGGYQIVGGVGTSALPSFAMNTTVQSGGILMVSAGGSAGSSYVLSTSTGDQSAVSGAPTVASGGIVHVVSGGVTLGALLQGSGAVENAFFGGSAASTTVLAGANLYAYSGGFTIAATVQSGGLEAVWGSGTFASNATVQIGGIEDVKSGAVTSNATIQTGGVVHVHLAGSSVAALVQSGGVEKVWGSGSVASNTTVQSVGSAYFYSGGSALNATIQSGGDLWAWDSGTIVSGANIMSGGRVFIHGGAVVGSTTLNGGTLELYSSGGTNGDAITFTTLGGTVLLDDSVHTSGVSISGLTPTAGTIDFGDISYSAGVTSVTWAQSAGSGTLTLTSGALQASVMLFGTYVASSFKLASDAHGGTNVTDPAVGNDAQNLLTQPHA